MAKQGEDYHYFQHRISLLESEVERLSHYEYEHRLLKEVVADCLLQGQLVLSELPQDIRLLQGDDLFFTYAWRYVEAKGDCQGGITILKILQGDLGYFFSIGKLSDVQYTRWMVKWLSFLERGKIAFKGEKDFECYFQDQKEANRGLFDDFDL